jgi:hypothetical protein
MEGLGNRMVPWRGITEGQYAGILGIYWSERGGGQPPHVVPESCEFADTQNRKWTGGPKYNK